MIPSGLNANGSVYACRGGERAINSEQNGTHHRIHGDCSVTSQTCQHSGDQKLGWNEPTHGGDRLRPPTPDLNNVMNKSSCLSRDTSGTPDAYIERLPYSFLRGKLEITHREDTWTVTHKVDVTESNFHSPGSVLDIARI